MGQTVTLLETITWVYVSFWTTNKKSNIINPILYKKGDSYSLLSTFYTKAIET